MIIGERIAKCRKEKKLSQEYIAESIEVSRQAVSKWERDEGYPSIDTLMDLAKLMNVSINELLGKDDVKTIVVNNNDLVLEFLKMYMLDK